MGWKTTSTILERLAASTKGTVWDGVLSRFRGSIVRFAGGMGLPKEDAEDVGQETMLAFLLAYRAGYYDRSRGRLSKWLFGIALRQTLNARRALAARHARLEFGKEPTFWAGVADRASDVALWAKEWERAVLESYLDQVRQEVAPKAYQAFEMVLRGDRTPAETASALGVPVRSVYNAKHRVLQRIRQLREEHEDALLCCAGPTVP